MPQIEIRDPEYTTIAIVRARFTSIPIDPTYSDSSLIRIILRAEDIIDLMVGNVQDRYYSQFEEESEYWQFQRLKFPRLQDVEVINDILTPYIPYNISEATILLTNFLYEIEVKKTNASSQMQSIMIKSIKVGDVTVSSSDYSSDFITKLKETQTGNEIMQLLNPYIYNFSTL